jgi:pseudouridine-5'-phosphate glycosidase
VTVLAIAPEVQRALAGSKPIVALESAVITHGLPGPAALEAVECQVAACQKVGALPAVVAVFGGALRVGLSSDECRRLAERSNNAKVSPWNLASAISSPGFGGTTVAATIRAAAEAGIRIISTGGIGGVHPGSNGIDVSADLTELSRHQVCVVCAGPKSTLDAGATLERLETLGVPVIGWRSSLLAGFLSVSAGLRLPARADTIDALASIVRQHWALGGAGLVVSQPITGHLAIDRADLTNDGALGVRGPGRTPAELRELQLRLGDRVIDANVGLLESNAGLAASLALALSRAPATKPRE